MPPKNARKDAKKASQTRKKTDASIASLNSANKSEAVEDHKLPIELQQIILNVFRTAFPISADVGALNETIQEVKGHLYNRDFALAFSEQSNLDAYAVRWSAARALGYAQILTEPERKFLFGGSADADSSNKIATKDDKVICIGGGAGAEPVAMAAAARNFQRPVSILAMDSADWFDQMTRLTEALCIAPTLPSYASEAARARPENQALLQDPSVVSVKFLQQDVLSWLKEDMQPHFQGATLCTIMFTLNELFSTSIPKTTKFLLDLTSLMPKGSHLIVIDSPGSYSEIKLPRDRDTSETPTETKKYPMKYLLDLVLLESVQRIHGQIHAQKQWEKIESEDSRWFRIDPTDREKLKYPVELENMRYQIHLYRHL